ncbi:hypothetical protein QAD02_000098 [Eretmocerus hayati]|uniref:Uncharacterized protein n=2 Tax=Eretmocerus hayati TaxID=131215 RepID=A0ACC2NCP0_9HYME|nr:hypothetical protein QAD02_000093 [Eretmocerus hayati]KAJ8668839.1 hypothetical protein QAD02_000098 [Eretmocerus hayati]
MSESDNDELQLHPDTLAALNEFYKEREESEKQFERALENNDCTQESLDIQENWQLSQFWYDENTIKAITDAALKCTDDNSNIALISCPSLYKALKKKSDGRQVKLFEFDQRFSVFGTDFIFYDYNTPQNIPADLHGIFDLVICDPPFLSEECLSKTAITVRLLMKKKVVLCTGAIMEELSSKLLAVKKCTFTPHHKNNLANEFSCYSNFNFDNCIN